MPHIQIKNVPPELHAELRRLAEERGQTLSEYLLEELAEFTVKPTVDEWLEMVRRERTSSFPYSVGAEVIRAERDENS